MPAVRESASFGIMQSKCDVPRAPHHIRPLIFCFHSVPIMAHGFDLHAIRSIHGFARHTLLHHPACGCLGFDGSWIESVALEKVDPCFHVLDAKLIKKYEIKITRNADRHMQTKRMFRSSRKEGFH